MLVPNVRSISQISGPLGERPLITSRSLAPKCCPIFEIFSPLFILLISAGTKRLILA